MSFPVGGSTRVAIGGWGSVHPLEQSIFPTFFLDQPKINSDHFFKF